MHLNPNRIKGLISTLMFTINLFRYLVFNCHFPVPISGGGAVGGGGGRKKLLQEKMVKDVIWAALLCFSKC